MIICISGDEIIPKLTFVQVPNCLFLVLCTNPALTHDLADKHPSDEVPAVPSPLPCLSLLLSNKHIVIGKQGVTHDYVFNL